MKTLSTLIISIIYLCLPEGVVAQYNKQQYFDGADTVPVRSIFIVKDTGAGNIWQIGKPAKALYFKGAATVPNALITDTANSYPPNNTSSFYFTVDSLPFPRNSIIAFRWKQKLDFEAGKDGGIVEVSKNGGVWQNIFNNPSVYNLYGFDQANKDTLPSGAYAFSGRDTSWRDIWLCFGFVNSKDTFSLRFTMVSDSANNGEGWMIDNLLVQRTLQHTVSSIEMNELVRVYPTLTTGVLHIDASHTSQKHVIKSLSIVNADGKLVRQYNDEQDRFLIDIADLPQGQYYVSAVTNLGKESTPVTLIHR
jgi:hypothetical protein